MTLLASILVLTNLAYTAAFDSETRSPAWVEYSLSAQWTRRPRRVSPDTWTRRPRRVSHAFRADPRAPGSDLARDYARSGYDRGHLAPAADFAFDDAALSETYLYTNVIPQDPAVNRGRWREIEEEVRALAASGAVRVLIAPQYDPAVTNLCGRVRVPDHLVKVVWGAFGCRVYRVPNEAAAKSAPTRGRDALVASPPTRGRDALVASPTTRGRDAPVASDEEMPSILDATRASRPLGVESASNHTNATSDREPGGSTRETSDYKRLSSGSPESKGGVAALETNHPQLLTPHSSLHTSQ